MGGTVTKDDQDRILQIAARILFGLLAAASGYLWHRQDMLVTQAADRDTRLAVVESVQRRADTIPGDFDRKLESLAVLIRAVDVKVSAVDTRVARVETKLESR